jgi:uncharacterized RDD family membrane protein YckC
MSSKKIIDGEIQPKFFKRALSFIIDIIIINVIIIWPFQKLFYGYANTGMNIDILPLNIYLAIILIFILSWLYFSFMEYYLGQSIGQMVLQLKVSEDLSLWKSLFRNCYMMPFFPFYILWIVEPVYLAFFKERLLEKISGTKTISSNIYKSYNYRLKKV